jgi:hypothetical protein
MRELLRALLSHYVCLSLGATIGLFVGAICAAARRGDAD